jgi:signal transduction histidine kinase
MNIRTKITLTFFCIVIIVLSSVSISIFLLSSEYRQEDFYRRLKNRAINTAMVLTEIKEVNADLLRRMEKNNPASLPNQFVAVFNTSYEQLYRSDGPDVIPVDTVLLKQIEERKEILIRRNEYEAIGFAMNGPDYRYIVVATAQDVYGLNALGNLRNTLITIFGVSIFLVSGIGWWYAGRVLNPVKKIVREVSHITEANLNSRLDEGNKRDELSMLSMTFNRMLRRLQQAFLAQRSFIANASHEIKTPITIMAGELEVALIQNRSSEYYKTTLRSVLQGLKSMNTLSTQLLLLAQTSTDHADKQFLMLRIDDLIWEVKEEMQKAFSAYIINVDFDPEVAYEALSIAGDELLLKAAIANLMENGCKYSNDHTVNISIHSRIPSMLSIDFENQTDDFDINLQERMFSPFYRGKNAGRAKGFGIGLSLVLGIAKLHLGEITVSKIQPDWVRFTLSLPTRSGEV